MPGTLPLSDSLSLSDLDGRGEKSSPRPLTPRTPYAYNIDTEQDTPTTKETTMGRKRYREQAQKDRSLERVRMVQGLRMSNAAEPIPSGRSYNRAKVRNDVQRNGWGD